MELKTKHSDAVKKWKEQIKGGGGEKRVDTGEGGHVKHVRKMSTRIVVCVSLSSFNSWA